MRGNGIKVMSFCVGLILIANAAREAIVPAISQ
jgi:hypothetical protein